MDSIPGGPCRALPVALQRLQQGAVVHLVEPRAGQHHQVQPLQKRLMLAKALPDQALDAIAAGGPAQVLLGNGQSQAGPGLPRGAVEDGEITVTGACRLLEDPPVIGTRQQAGTARKALRADGAVSSGRQASASLGPAGIDHLAATLGGHACAEAVGAGALQVAGLECAFHDVTRS